MIILAEPAKASDLLRDILAQAGRGRARNRFHDALDEVLSPTHRANCQVVGFRNGKLTVEVASSPLFAELSGFRREELRIRLNELLPEQPIAQLTFRLGGTGHV